MKYKHNAIPTLKHLWSLLFITFISINGYAQKDTSLRVYDKRIMEGWKDTKSDTIWINRDSIHKPSDISWYNCDVVTTNLHTNQYYITETRWRRTGSFVSYTPLQVRLVEKLRKVINLLLGTKK